MHSTARNMASCTFPSQTVFCYSGTQATLESTIEISRSSLVLTLFRIHETRMTHAGCSLTAAERGAAEAISHPVDT